MFFVIPLIEFLHVRGVDIDVHHENPTTLLWHISFSSAKRSRHRFASSRGHPVVTPGAREGSSPIRVAAVRTVQGDGGDPGGEPSRSDFNSPQPHGFLPTDR